MKNNVLTNEAFIAKAHEIYDELPQECTANQMLRRLENATDYIKTLEDALHEVGA